MEVVVKEELSEKVVGIRRVCNVEMTLLFVCFLRQCDEVDLCVCSIK